MTSRNRNLSLKFKCSKSLAESGLIEVKYSFVTYNCNPNTCAERSLLFHVRVPSHAVSAVDGNFLTRL